MLTGRREAGRRLAAALEASPVATTFLCWDCPVAE